jgi:SAM-dependent methyltransferase
VATAHDPGRLLRCRTCGVGQRQPAPDEQTLIGMYRETPAEDMAYRYEENAAWSLARQRLLARLANAREPAVLDVGCHTGAFLAGLPAAWRKHGIESAREPIRIAREQHGVTIIGERLETIDDEWTGQFEAVTLFDVVEHLPHPDAGIAQAARLLKPGGVLMLSSGDLDAWTWRWLGSGHWYLQTPQHLTVLSRRFLVHVADWHALTLTDVQRIPHRDGSLRERCRETIKALYWGMRRRRGIYRLPHRLLQSLPGLRDLRHMQSVPWTMKLKDHLLAQMEPSKL